MTAKRAPGSTPPARGAGVEAGVAAGHRALLGAFATHLAARPAHTRNAYLRDVAQLLAMAGDTPPAKLARAQLMRFIATLHGRGLSGRSLARMLSAWRGFYRYLARDHGHANNPCVGLRAPKAKKSLPHALSPDEAGRMMDLPDDDELATRDKAIFELFYFLRYLCFGW